MRIDRLVLKGLSSAFPGVIDLNFSDLAPGLVAICGSNGAGKTTILEATPGLIFRRLPSRDGADPMELATERDSFIELTFTVDGRGTFRARLNMDSPKRQSDAVLLAILPDGTPAALSDGKKSTYDACIKERFPSYDLFVNSSFAAQGRGDEFTRRKPSQRKDLFVEFLGLQAYATMASAAGEAGKLAADARLRLAVQLEQLQRDTAPALLQDIERRADVLQTQGGAAELRKRELMTVLEALEQRMTVISDQVAAYTAAQALVVRLQGQLATWQAQRGSVARERVTVTITLAAETRRISEKREAAVAEADTRIAGNQQIQGLADQIRAAVAALATLEPQLAQQRADLSAQHAEQRQADKAVREVEQRIAALVPVEQRLTRATRDASLLGTVPCGGVGEFAACQFLQDATAAHTQMHALETELAPKAALADALHLALHKVQALTVTATALQGSISALEALTRQADAHAKYDGALKESTAKIAGYEDAKATVVRDAAEQVTEAQARHDARLVELDRQGLTIDTTIATVIGDLAIAETELVLARSGNSQAVQLQGELADTRREWDQVITTLATVQSERDELERRRHELASKHARLVDVRHRCAAVEQELLEWRDLAKALGKGGLPDLEIDAAGPTISATTNAILLECFGPRFSLELVTQVAKTDGSGMKDLFTVEVTDNEAGGAVRDISGLSGGEKVIVQEALMCSIALFVNERMPMPIRTLFRDETGAALDPENAIRYVQMLRKVRTLGGYHHVIFISHNPAAAELADAQIRVGDGQATIVLPPFLEVRELPVREAA